MNLDVERARETGATEQGIREALETIRSVNIRNRQKRTITDE